MESDKQSMMELVTYFAPIINKYTRRMRNDEDFKSDITIYLIELINEMKLSKFRVPNDYAIINYVKKIMVYCVKTMPIQYMFLNLTKV